MLPIDLPKCFLLGEAPVVPVQQRYHSCDVHGIIESVFRHWGTALIPRLVPEEIKDGLGEEFLYVASHDGGMLGLAHLSAVAIEKRSECRGELRLLCRVQLLRRGGERRQQKVRENKAEELDGRRDGLVRS